ncbi:MAG: Ppx/GppA family phosphatase, partial [Sphingomonadaceae bacterium]
LGRDISTRGTLAEESIEMALRGLRRYAVLLTDHDITDVEVVATAAVRDASNGNEFLEQIRAIGFTPRLLSGEEEARTSAMGVIGAFPGAQGVVADLGGGSLEFTRIGAGGCEPGTSLPLGTLRLHEWRESKPSAMSKSIGKLLDKEGWGRPIDAPLYLVGGTWRAMAVYAMQQRNYPLTDPHGFELSAKEAAKLGSELAGADPEDLRKLPRISSMRANYLPDAGALLQALVEKLAPERLVISSWGLREGLLYQRLDSVAQQQDPLLAGMALFAAQRGAPPTLAARVAGWTVDAVPELGKGSERLRLAATMMALASMQTEPNLRLHQAMDWALHKRWLALEPCGRAMIAATVLANGNQCDLPEELQALASEEQLEEAICWGLAIRLCRRIGASSRRSFNSSGLRAKKKKLILRLEESHADLFGIPNEKDLKLLADRLGLEPEMRVVPVGTVRPSDYSPFEDMPVTG